MFVEQTVATQVTNVRFAQIGKDACEKVCGRGIGFVCTQRMSKRALQTRRGCFNLVLGRRWGIGPTSKYLRKGVGHETF